MCAEERTSGVRDRLREHTYLCMAGARRESEVLAEIESEEEGRSHIAKGLGICLESKRVTFHDFEQQKNDIFT